MESRLTEGTESLLTPHEQDAAWPGASPAARASLVICCCQTAPDSGSEQGTSAVSLTGLAQRRGAAPGGAGVPARGSGGNRLTRAPSAAGAGSDPVLLGSRLGPNCWEAAPLGDAAAFAAAPACALPAAARSLGASPAQRRPPFTSSALLLGQRGPLTPPTFPANSVRLC